MFGLFGKKKDKSNQGNSSGESIESDEGEIIAETKKNSAPVSSNPEIAKINIDLDRLKASVESFSEVRKSLTDRISGISEQIGELRAMILDRDRTIQEIELKAVKAADLVETVQPEKLMIEVQKEDAKFEALKANLEGNEAIMDKIMEDMREIRKKIDFFRGVEEMVKLSEEVKKELIDIKKVEAAININADKVQTMYDDLKKKSQSIDMFNDSLQEFKVSLGQNSKDIESLKFKLSGLSTKEDFDKFVSKVQKHMDDLKELNRQSSLTKDIARLKSMLDTAK